MYQSWYFAVEGKWDESQSARCLHCCYQSRPCVFCGVFLANVALFSIPPLLWALIQLNLLFVWYPFACRDSFGRPCSAYTNIKGKVSLFWSRANVELRNSSFLCHVVLQMSTFYPHLSLLFGFFFIQASECREYSYIRLTGIQLVLGKYVEGWTSGLHATFNFLFC